MKTGEKRLFRTRRKFPYTPTRPAMNLSLGECRGSLCKFPTEFALDLNRFGGQKIIGLFLV
jgi:hypothetical protein